MTCQADRAKTLSWLDQLDEEQIAQYRKAFSLFDRGTLVGRPRHDDGTIPSAALGALMRSLGQTIEYHALQDMIREADPAMTGTLDFPDFMQLMARRCKLEDEDEKWQRGMEEAMAALDTAGTGYLPLDDCLESIQRYSQTAGLALMGECLTEADM